MAAGVIRMGPRAGTAKAAVTETSPVLVTVSEVARGVTIAEGDLKLQDWPKNLVPEGASTDAKAVVGRVAMSTLLPGEIVLEKKIASEKAGRGLAAFIPPGKRAYTIQTPRTASNVAGFIVPGDKVDVLLNLKSIRDDGTGGGSTSTLLQAVEVLAVDQVLEVPEGNKVDTKEVSSVTLLVTPEEMLKLDLGQNAGQLTLSLRNPEDRLEAAAKPATLTGIRGGPPKEEMPPAELAPPPEAAPPPPKPATDSKQPAVYGFLNLRGRHRSQTLVTETAPSSNGGAR
jgi:pilus assembly protein CpaB